MALLSHDVDPLWIARYDYHPGWRLPPHKHDCYFQLILIVGGRGTALVGSASVPLEARQILFMPPGLEHGLEIACDSSVVCTLDTKFRVRHPALQRACRKIAPVHWRPDRRIRPLLETMHVEAEQHGPLAAEACQALLIQVLLLLLQKTTAAPVVQFPLADDESELGSSLCARLGRFLREHSAQPINQRVLSQALNYSYRHLHEHWRALHGESPLQSLRRYRIKQAMQMIRYSDYELKRIAEMTGFTSVYHFTRVFKDVTGVPPARWRERERFGVGRDIVIKRGFINQVLTETALDSQRGKIAQR